MGEGTVELSAIKEIVDNKIQTMLDDKTILKTIEQTVEECVLRSLKDCLGSYDLSRKIKDKILEEISPQLEIMDLSNYTNKIVNDMCKIIESEQGKDLRDRVRQSYKELFEPVNKEYPIQKLIDKYVEQFEDLDGNERYEINSVSSELSEDSSIGLSYTWVTLKLRKSESNDDDNFEIRLFASDKGNKFKISSIYAGYFQDKKLHECLGNKYYSHFERFLLNAYLNETEFTITDDDFREDEYSLGDW